MNIGIICYASVGGSGIIATELGKMLATRGHSVHILSSDTPFRFGDYEPGLHFHRVDTPDYPLFREPQYILSLANKVVQVARHERLDIVHAHYAIPHATAAYLARQILASTGGDAVPRTVTTLHGTDITLLGSDRSFTETVAFCIDQSDGVTAVSESLKADTLRELDVTSDIRVIPNFLNWEVHRRVDASALRARLAQPDERVVIHVSNFRPVKRVPVVVRIFAAIRAAMPARLLMVGHGPDRSEAEAVAVELGVAADVEFLGEQERVTPLLSASDLFLLPSSQESFGLAALEAMACEVPVIASRVGGLPEVIQHGDNGFLYPPDEVDAMAESAIALLRDEPLRRRVGVAAARTARERFGADKIVTEYERFYEEILSRFAPGAHSR